MTTLPLCVDLPTVPADGVCRSVRRERATCGYSTTRERDPHLVQFSRIASALAAAAGTVSATKRRTSTAKRGIGSPFLEWLSFGLRSSRGPEPQYEAVFGIEHPGRAEADGDACRHAVRLQQGLYRVRTGIDLAD